MRLKVHGASSSSGLHRTVLDETEALVCAGYPVLDETEGAWCWWLAGGLHRTVLDETDVMKGSRSGL